VQVAGQGGEGGRDPGPDAGEALPPVLRHPLAVDEPLLEASEGDVDGEVPDLRGVVHRGGGEAVAGGCRGTATERERWMEGLRWTSSFGRTPLGRTELLLGSSRDLGWAGRTANKSYLLRTPSLSFKK
jgi:hypothetical protein